LEILLLTAKSPNYGQNTAEEKQSRTTKHNNDELI